jgi:hypothetical protein
MGLRDLSGKAKQVFEERGGSERLKQDSHALKNIARGEGSLSEKAKAGLGTLRDEPTGTGHQAGGPGETGAEHAADPPPPAQTDARPDPGAPAGSTERPGTPPSRS